MTNDGLACSSPGSSKHVMIVEDNNALRFCMREQFEQAGLKCSSAENGVVAQSHLVNNRIDLVITDYHMPIMGGLEFIEWMRRNGYHVPIILLSGDLPKGMRAQVERTNIFAILNKPCLFSELYLKVLEVFDES